MILSLMFKAFKANSLRICSLIFDVIERIGKRTKGKEKDGYFVERNRRLDGVRNGVQKGMCDGLFR